MGETKEDQFYCGLAKFKKMLKAMALESKIDKAIAFYHENEGRLHDCPFV